MPNVQDEPAFYNKVDDASEYQTVSLMCVPIYSTAHILEVAPNDPNLHTAASHTSNGSTSSLNIVGIVQLINKISTVKSRDSTAKNNFVAFTEQDCIRACAMLNCSTRTVQTMFGLGDLAHASSLNSAVEDALRLDVPWARIIRRLTPIQKVLKSLRLDVVKLEALHDPCYEPGYHFDRSCLTHRMLENTLDADFNSVSNSGKSFRLLQSSAVSCLNTRAANGDSPLMKAVTCQRNDLVQEFLKSGANPYFANSRGNTALHLAASSNNCTVLHLLVAAVCDPFAINEAGHTPRFLCELAIKKVLCLHDDTTKQHNHLHKHAVQYLCDQNHRKNRNHRNHQNHQTKKHREAIHMLAIDRMQALSSEEKITSNMFPHRNTSRELIDLCKLLKDHFACRRMLLAAEAVWLRVLNRGHTNEWHNTNGTADVPLPPLPLNVIHSENEPQGEWDDHSIFVGWDMVHSIYGVPPTLSFEITASPTLETVTLVVETAEARKVAGAHNMQREFGILVQDLQLGTPYTFKIVAVNTCGCSPESSWSLPMNNTQQNDLNSAVEFHPEDSVHTQHLKSLYWEGVAPLKTVKPQILEQPRALSKIEKDKHASHHYLQWEKQEVLMLSCVRRGNRLRHLRSLRKRSKKESDLRTSGKILSLWVHRNFASCDDVESAIYHRVVQNSVPVGVKPSLTLGVMQAGYTGLDICKFHVQCIRDTAAGATTSEGLHPPDTPPPLHIARGNPGVSFVFSYDGTRSAKIRKSTLQSTVSITIAAFALNAQDLPVKFHKVALEHRFSFPIQSTSVVVTRGRLEFGNGVVNVLCPPEIFNLSNINYYIHIPQGAFQVGLADPRSPWCDSPEIRRCVRTSNSQILWDRCGHCPVAARKVVWRALQLAEASINHTVVPHSKPTKLETGKRPILQTHTPPIILRRPKESLKDIKNNSALDICHMCQNHVEPNTYFAMKTTKTGDTQCWHPRHERCEVCGHEWVDNVGPLEADVLKQLREDEAEFLINPSLTSEHFFYNVEVAQKLRFSPHMLHELSTRTSENLATTDPDRWTEDTIVQSILYFSNKNIGPILAREEECTFGNNDNQNYKKNLGFDDKIAKTDQFSFDTLASIDATSTKTHATHVMAPQTNALRSQILEMFHDAL